jgi:ribosomal protein S18 acetylase RimI-like enzyme
MDSVDSVFSDTFDTKGVTFDEARTVIGRAFAGTDKAPADPIFAFLTAPLGPMKQDDLNILATFMLGFAVYEPLQLFKNCLYIGERDAASGDLMSCMLLREYDPNEKASWFVGLKKAWYSFSCFVQMRSGGVPDLYTDPKRKPQEKQLMANADNLDKTMQIWHKEHGVAEKHWYVCLLGVHPDHQGKGLGRKIIERLNDSADSKSMKCYLECSGAKNQAFYEKCGYTKHADVVLTDPTDKSRSLDGKIMIRQPKPKSSS